MDESPVCGTAVLAGRELEAGEGNRALGRMRLAERELSSREERGESPLAIAKAALDLSEALEAMGEQERAKAFLERALRTPGFRTSDDWAHACQSHALRALWRKDFARGASFAREYVHFARTGRARDPEPIVDALVTLAEACIGLGDYREARGLLLEARERYDVSSALQKHFGGFELGILLHTARAEAGLGNYDDAVRALDEVEEKVRNPRWATMRIHLDVLMASAAIRRDAGRIEEAQERARGADDWWRWHIERPGASSELKAEGAAAREALERIWG